ncbi:glycosyltransferase involved in cell wall biosynthesis [Methylohalomonas lacus]|uniref:Glycosyltransferase involved in cell wall biosynthesis n=1 Tax=Methylohalomonas lacus TaxID=398773 RepID=A0AAE3HK53_9GAMM|nr:glycosyltransferase [Methylohalomonas lacus]MCS3902673.1 glycosyltransferase involved in cell wall biosynthesis [Methylohalomonas lacus]
MKSKPAQPDVLIVGKANNYGLTKDTQLLEYALAQTGLMTGRATTRQRGLIEALLRRRRARVVVHIERIHPRWLHAGDQHWLIPNQERFPRRHLGRLAGIDRVLAKTRHAEEIFQQAGARAVSYLGFTSEDCRDVSVEKDWQRFFHMAGANTLKGTEDLIDLWGAHPEWPELLLLQKADRAPKVLPANVRLEGGYLSGQALRYLQNGYGIHLCPSRSEGWGHHILEAMSTGALVLTTDAPPMNELVTADAGVRVGWARSQPRHLGHQYFVDRSALEAAIENLIAISDADKAALGSAARARYEAIDQAFHERVQAIFAELN